jgi:cytochrome c5
MNLLCRSAVARTLALLIAVLAASACYPRSGPAPGALSPATVAASSTRWPGVTAASLETGRDLFVARCNSCHGYPDLSAIGDDRWPRVLDKMAPKAGLTADQKAEVLHFVLAWRAQLGS